VALIEAAVAHAFGVRRQVRRMFGSEKRTYLARPVDPRQSAAPIVLRRFSTNPERHARLRWQLDILASLRGDGFRSERPLQAQDGKWIVDGWTAWTFVEGRVSQGQDAPEVLDGVEALHRALADVPYSPVLALHPSQADRVSWGEDPLPPGLPAVLLEPLERLASVRRPLEGLRPPQLIHGDMHWSNILIASKLPPAFIDWSMAWRPPEYAAAIAAYWVGPNSGDEDVLRHFSRVPHFEQLLVRVAMRQLLFFVERGIPSHVPNLGSFGRAAEMVYRLARP
jgi:uncharacterized protein (TIGR02569 family)